jgi:hypothetical protein
MIRRLRTFIWVILDSGIIASKGARIAEVKRNGGVTAGTLMLLLALRKILTEKKYPSK